MLLTVSVLVVIAALCAGFESLRRGRFEIVLGFAGAGALAALWGAEGLDAFVYAFLWLFVLGPGMTALGLGALAGRLARG